MVKTLQVKQINFEGGTQARVKLDTDVVDAYAEVLTESNGDALPPIDVYSDGSDYWLSDGFHRFHAHMKVGLGTIKANVHTGTRRDAILASVGANAEHGLKRSNADKRKAVKMLLDDQEWSQRSDRWIAEKAKVNHKFVAKVRVNSTGDVSSSRVGQDGKERKLPETKPKPEPTPQQQVHDYFDDKTKQASDPEPQPEQPKQRDRNEEIRLQRSKTVNTCEALLRAIDDLHLLLPRRQKQDVCIDQAKRILEVVRSWT